MQWIPLCSLLIAWAITTTASADGAPVAVLDFELNDLTLQPNTAEELERTASIMPLLADELAEKYGYRIVRLDPAIQANANAGFGYLFDHHNVAAGLGRDAGARWVVVGRVHKASFLFVYFLAHVIDAQTGRLVGDVAVEVKGPQRKLTVRGIESLAQRTAASILSANQK
jgi:hypothetical protein